MKDGKYYEFLHTIPYEGRKDLNSLGFVALSSIPFKLNSDAVTYIMHYHPELNPADHPVIQDRARCRTLAAAVMPEVKHNLERVEQMKEEAYAKLEGMRKRYDQFDERDLLESIQKEVLRDEIHRQCGICEGLSMAWQMLHRRNYELWECTRMKG